MNLVWEADEWIESDELNTSLKDNGNLASVFDITGGLSVSYLDNQSAEDGAEVSRLYGMWRMVEMPSELPTPPPILTPTLPAPTPMSTPAPEPTPTVFFSTEREDNQIENIPGIGNLPISLDMLLAFIPVLLIVGLAIIIGVRISRRR